MLCLHVKNNQRIIVTHGGERLEVWPNTSAPLYFQAPKSFAIVRENAVVKEPKSKEAASDSRN